MTNLKKFYFPMVVALVMLFTACQSPTAGKAQQGKMAPSNSAHAEKVQPTGNVKEFNITAKQWEFIPDTITVNRGDTVKLHIKSIDVPHGYSIPEYGINKILKPGKVADVEFVANKVGTFTSLCSVYCGSGHSKMRGKLIVE